LDHLVHEAQREQPGIGLRLLMGKLRSKGIRIQWERLRYSLLRTDPTGVHLRWRKAIRRRKYWVPGPLALWHIDGNHKLIRFVYRPGAGSGKVQLLYSRDKSALFQE